MNCNTCAHQNVCHKFLFEECPYDNCSDYAEERKAGHWLSRYYYRESTNSYDVHMFVCSECDYEFSYDMETGRSDNNFCPNCGADMRGDRE